MPQIKITLTKSELEEVKEWACGAQLAPLAKHVLMRTVRDRKGPQGTTKDPEGPVPQRDHEGPQGTARDPDQPGTELALSSSQKEKEKKKKAREPRLAPLDVSERVLSALNAAAETDYQHTGKMHRQHIQRALDRGLSEADLLTIIRKMCAQWKNDPKMVKYLRPSTLFGSKAEEYRDGAEVRPGRSQVSIDISPEDMMPE